MTLYRATSLGMIRGAIVSIEETVRQRAINDLTEQERAAVLSDAQTILDILAEQGTINVPEPEHTTLSDALKDINTVLDVASAQSRPPDPLERAAVARATRAILLLLKMVENSSPP